MAQDEMVKRVTEGWDVISDGPGLAGRNASGPPNEPPLNGAQLARATELAHRKVTATLNDFQVRQWCIEAAVKMPAPIDGSLSGGSMTIAIAQAFYEFIMKAVDQAK